MFMVYYTPNPIQFIQGPIEQQQLNIAASSAVFCSGFSIGILDSAFKGETESQRLQGFGSIGQRIYDRKVLGKTCSTHCRMIGVPDSRMFMLRDLHGLRFRA